MAQGKTTLIRIINQIAASRQWGSLPSLEKKFSLLTSAMIGYLPEERGLYKKMKVGEQCSILAQLKGLSKAEAKKRLFDWFKRFQNETWWIKKWKNLAREWLKKFSS